MKFTGELSEELKAELEIILKDLQKEIAAADFWIEKRRQRSGQSSNMLLEYVVGDFEKTIILQMRADRNHQKPHLHIYFKGKENLASFSIKPEAVLVKSKSYSGEHDKRTLKWIKKNQSTLLEVWRMLKNGEDPKELVVELRSRN